VAGFGTSAGVIITKLVISKSAVEELNNLLDLTEARIIEPAAPIEEQNRRRNQSRNELQARG